MHCLHHGSTHEVAMFCYTKPIIVDGKAVLEHQYWGFWLWRSKRSLLVDYELTLAQGFEVRQYVNGRLFAATI